jgi:hypothetical protein
MPDETQTRDFFSAMDKIAGEKGENRRLLRPILPKINRLFQHISTRIVPALYPLHEILKGGLQLCPKGEKIFLFTLGS